MKYPSKRTEGQVRQTDRWLLASQPPSADRPQQPQALPSWQHHRKKCGSFLQILGEQKLALLLHRHQESCPGCPQEEDEERKPHILPRKALPRAVGMARARGCTPGCPEHLCPPCQHPESSPSAQPKWVISGFDSDPWRGEARHKTTQETSEIPEPRAGLALGSWHPLSPAHGGIEGQDKELGGFRGSSPLFHTPTSARPPSPHQSGGAALSVCITPVPPASFLPPGGPPEDAAAPTPCRQLPALQESFPSTPLQGQARAHPSSPI